MPRAFQPFAGKLSPSVPFPGVNEDIRKEGKIGKVSHLRCHTDKLGLQVRGSTWEEESGGLLTGTPLWVQSRRKPTASPGLT